MLIYNFIKNCKHIFMKFTIYLRIISRSAKFIEEYNEDKHENVKQSYSKKNIHNGIYLYSSLHIASDGKS